MAILKKLGAPTALTAASLVAVAFPPVGFWPLVLLGIFYFAAPLALPENLKPRATALHFFYYSFFVNLLGFYWLAHTLNEFGGLHIALAVVLTFFIFVLSSVFSAFWGFLWPFFARAATKRLPRVSIFVWLFLWLVLWDSLDFRLFPWSPVMAFGQDRALMASVHLFQTGGWRLLFFALITFWVSLNYLSGPSKFKKAAYRFVPSLCLFFSIVYLVGLYELKSLKNAHPHSQQVALLQGNVGNYEKKLSKLQIEPTVKNVLRIHQDLVESAAIYFASQEARDPWVIWPETSFPGFPLLDSDLQSILLRWTRLTQGLHIVGAYHNDLEEWGDRKEHLDFNVVVLAEPRGLGPMYKKMIRLPFGEYVPGDHWFPSVYDRFPQLIHFGRGKEFTALPHPNPKGPVFIPLVCYEVLSATFIKEFINTAQKTYPGRELILVNLSNDSWYGETSEPFQHSLLARWQAAQVGLPLLRPTNTGLSQIIAPWGEVLAQGPRNESVVIHGKLPRKEAPL